MPLIGVRLSCRRGERFRVPAAVYYENLGPPGLYQMQKKTIQFCTSLNELLHGFEGIRLPCARTSARPRQPAALGLARLLLVRVRVRAPA